MDESVINGANLFFPDQFGISQTIGTPSQLSRNQWLLGLVNGAPYVSLYFLCCVILRRSDYSGRGWSVAF